MLAAQAENLPSMFNFNPFCVSPWCTLDGLLDQGGCFVGRINEIRISDVQMFRSEESPCFKGRRRRRRSYRAICTPAPQLQPLTGSDRKNRMVDTGGPNELPPQGGDRARSSDTREELSPPWTPSPVGVPLMFHWEHLEILSEELEEVFGVKEGCPRSDC